MAAQFGRLALAAAPLQMGIQRREALEAGDRHQEVPAAIADQALDLTLVVALAGPPEAIGEEVVGLPPAEPRVRRRVPSPGCGPQPAWGCLTEPARQSVVQEKS